MKEKGETNTPISLSPKSPHLNLLMATTIPPAAPIELEGMRKDDSSWHPCQVSLSSDGLVLDFGSEGSEDIIFDKEQVLARVRFRSTPLEEDDCCHIKEGEHILASEERLSGTLFFDAEVEKVFRVRHSKRIHCRCMFQINWFHPDHKGGPVTVPASSIMKLAIKCIDTHPIVREFLNSVETLSYSGVSPFGSLFEDPVFEPDLSKMLEKQIEEIGKLADVTKEANKEDFLHEVRRDLTGYAQHEIVSSPANLLLVQASSLQNNSRRTTRRQSKKEMEMTIENPPRTQVILDEPNRFHLTPLGARAALASLMNKLPPKEDSTDAVWRTPEKVDNVFPLDFSHNIRNSDAFIQEKVCIKDDFFSSEEPCLATDLARHTQNTKLHTSDKRDESPNAKLSSRMQNRLEKPARTPNNEEDMGSSAVTFKTGLTCSVSEQKLNHPTKTTRLTRSAIRKGIGLSHEEVDPKSFHDETKSRTPTYTTSNDKNDVGSKIVTGKISLTCSVADQKLNRPMKTTKLTRSAIQKGTRHSNDEIGVNSLHEETKLTSSTYTSNAKEDVGSSVVSLETSLTCSVLEQKFNHLKKTARLTRSAIQKGIINSKDELNLESPHEEIESMTSTYISNDNENVVGQSAVTFSANLTCSVSERKLNYPINTKKLPCLAIQNGNGHLSGEVDHKFSHKDMSLISPEVTRFTRSTIGKDVTNVTLEVSKGLEESNVTEDICSDSISEDLVTPETNAKRRKKPLSSPLDSEINASVSQERKKRPKVSNGVRLTTSEGETLGKGLRVQAEKQKSTFSRKKPIRRVSPRLNFLPRTRGQKKH